MGRLPGLFVHFYFVLFCSILFYKPTGGFNPSICEKKTQCDSCIGTFGCTWCKELREGDLQRCNTVEGHKHNKCKGEDIVNAEPSLSSITQKEPISKSMRIQPQKVNVKLSVGQDIGIDLRYNDNTDKALDLYYIMDLSATMEDDKKTVSKQAEILVEKLKEITGDVRLGFGAFIDKPVLPFVASSQLRSNNEFDLPYGFKNWLSLTDDIGKFRQVVKDAKISRNLDEPEGTLDALMQAITCTEEIKWRDTNTTRKLIVVATDGPFHIAGDGKLGGIVRPNDLKCHMENHTYTHSTLIDYPSIGEINAVILEHKVYVIFAVSKPREDEVYQVYDELQKYIAQSTTEQLNADSSNVVQKIRKKYLELSQTVTLAVEEAPNFVDVSVLVKCPKERSYVKQNTCNNVGVGQTIDFKINLKLKECPDLTKHRNLKEENKVVISFFELTEREKLIIDMEYSCKCNCNQEKNEDQNTLRKYCTGVDAAKFTSCGLCTCKDDRYGDTCQCSVANDQGNITNCVSPNTQYECSNRGECRCGQCRCPSDFNGQYCEYSTVECQNQNSQFPNRICSDHGQCNKGKCDCSEGYEGTYCECESTKKVSCVEPGQSIKNICNGHGTCMCSGSQAQCKCDSDYSGLYCGVCKINCPASPLKSRCQDKILQNCVRCRIRQYHSSKKNRQQCLEECNWERILEKEEGKGSGKRSDVGAYHFKELTSRESLSDEIGTECQVSINSSCTSTFKYSYHRSSQHDILQVLYSPHKLNCTVEPPVIWYIIGVIVSVLLAGIIGLLIWKLATHLHDRREYQKFEQERSNAKWHGLENPLYDKPTSDFENPAYARHSTVPSMK